MKKTLFIDKQHSKISIDRDRLLVHDGDGRPLSVALSLLSQVVIGSKVSLDTQVLLGLARHGVALIVSSSRDSTVASLLPPSAGVITRKLTAYRTVCDKALCLDFAKQLVKQQNRHSQKLLAHWQDRGLLDSDSHQQKVKTALIKLPDVADMDTLRGVEGETARILFDALARLAPSWCGFHGRNRRPPADPINAVLSLAFTLSYADCARALQAVSLDPYLGFYHQPYHGRVSLACDLAELSRVWTLAWVVELFLSKKLTADDFYDKDGACLLNKAGRSVFYQAWHGYHKALSRHHQRLSQLWAKHIDKLGES